MKCWHPNCTGVHDNNRYWELCPAALDRKRDRDNRYHGTWKGIRKRIRYHSAVAEAQIAEWDAQRAAEKKRRIAEGWTMEVKGFLEIWRPPVKEAS